MRFLRTFLGTALGLGLGLTLALVLIDPYDSGRLTPFAYAGIPETGPRMANASRLRQPAYDGVIIGNSTIQLISPERLDALTGQRFLQLSIPGTGPLEHLAIAERAVQLKGGGIRTVVIGLEALWCDVRRSIQPVHPFPFWLYSTTSTDYVKGLFRMDTLEFVPRRIRTLLGKEKLGSADGYWDYESNGGHDKFIEKPLTVPAIAGPVDGRGSNAFLLSKLLATLPATTRVVLVHPPVFAPDPPQMGPEDRNNLARCKGELAAVAQTRPGTILIDFWVDSDLTRNRSLFFDHNHYRAALAKQVERQISEAIARPK